MTEQEQQLEQALIALDEAWNELSRQISNDIKEYPFSVPRGQIYLLRLLDRIGPQRMSDLAEQLDLTQGGCSTLADRAVGSGLVERRRDPEDRRVVRVALSELGRETLADVRQVRAKLLAIHLKRLEPEEIATLTHLFERTAELVRTEPRAMAESLPSA